MQYFVSKTTPRTILIMFDRDDLLLEGIQEVVKKEKIDTAAITGGIGSLQRVHLHTITTTAVQSLDKYWNFTGAIELGKCSGFCHRWRCSCPYRRLRLGQQNDLHRTSGTREHCGLPCGGQPGCFRRGRDRTVQ